MAGGEKETSSRRRLFLCIGSDRKSLGCKHLLEPVTNTFILEALSSIVDGVWFVTVQCSSQTHKAPANRNGSNSDPPLAGCMALIKLPKLFFQLKNVSSIDFHVQQEALRYVYVMEWLDQVT